MMRLGLFLALAPKFPDLDPVTLWRMTRGL